jgi:hypothetical protein
MEDGEIGKRTGLRDPALSKKYTASKKMVNQLKLLLLTG